MKVSPAKPLSRTGLAYAGMIGCGVQFVALDAHLWFQSPGFVLVVLSFTCLRPVGDT